MNFELVFGLPQVELIRMLNEHTNNHILVELAIGVPMVK